MSLMSNPIVKYLFVVLISAGVLCLDQATKIFVHIQLRMGEPIALIEGFFNISYIGNSGGAFGLFGESPDWVRFILFLFFPIVCVVLIFMMLRETQNRFQVLALSFVLGGAGGNYLDRIRMGYVVDFIDWHIKDWHWPTFNVADSFIVTGVFILLFFYLREMRWFKSQELSHPNQVSK